MRAIARERSHRDVRLVCGPRARSAVAAALALGLSMFASTAGAAADAAEAKKIFNQRCTACHTFGKGVKVGPDLKGVNERRPRAWLLKFIRSSQSMIDSGDAVAVELFQQFKQQRMPDWTDLSEEQIAAILDWLAANGPEQRPADERPAELATQSDIELGRAIFHGSTELSSGGMACASCHSLEEEGEVKGGSLGPDLTSSYADYRDRALTLFLKQPCFRRHPDSLSAAYLTPQESFAIKSYLRRVALPDQKRQSADGSAPKAVEWSAAPPAPGSRSGRPGAPHGATVVKDEILFLAFPYAALLLLLGGIVVRHALARRHVDRIRRDAQAAWQLFGGSVAWRVGLVATAAAHLAGLLLPRTILAWNGEPIRLYVLEGAGFLFALLLLVGWGRVMWLHLGRTAGTRAAKASELADSVFLSLVFVSIATGLLVAGLHRWGSSWAGGTLAPYLESLMRGEPIAAFVVTMPFMVKAHVLSTFALMAVFPLTSAALMPVAALERALAFAARPAAASKRAFKGALARLSPSRWLWPEEDVVEGADPVADEVGGELQPERGIVYRPDSEKPHARG
jgi:mono/diheme cytochrome c family protein/nitrate reductase gamma subunit